MTIDRIIAVVACVATVVCMVMALLSYFSAGNGKDFKNSTVPAVTPEQFLKQIIQQQIIFPGKTYIRITSLVYVFYFIEKNITKPPFAIRTFSQISP